MTISAQTKLAAVFGNPIGHSLSPLLHNEIYKREGIDAVFLAFENPDIKKLIEAMRALPIHMAAVTIPHKETVLPLLDQLDVAAQQIGSVNTIINEGGLLSGYNTDYLGVAAALRGVTLAGKNVLVVGAGGAARAIAYHLKENAAALYCYDRTFEKAKGLCDRFGGTPLSALDDDAMRRRLIAFDVIINATPVGMSPNEDATPIPKEMIQSGSTVFDLIYKPRETRFMKEAQERGARTISGVHMFLAQALEQERLWLGREIKNEGYDTLLQ